MSFAPPGPLQKQGEYKNGKLGEKHEFGAWKITIVPAPSQTVTPDALAKPKGPIVKVVVAASLREIVNTYDDVIAAEFLGEGGVVVTLALAQTPEGQLALTPQGA